MLWGTSATNSAMDVPLASSLVRPGKPPGDHSLLESLDRAGPRQPLCFRPRPTATTGSTVLVPSNIFADTTSGRSLLTTPAPPASLPAPLASSQYGAKSRTSYAPPPVRNSTAGIIQGGSIGHDSLRGTRQMCAPVRNGSVKAPTLRMARPATAEIATDRSPANSLARLGSGAGTLTPVRTRSNKGASPGTSLVSRASRSRRKPDEAELTKHDNDGSPVFVVPGGYPSMLSPRKLRARAVDKSPHVLLMSSGGAGIGADLESSDSNDMDVECELEPNRRVPPAVSLVHRGSVGHLAAPLLPLSKGVNLPKPQKGGFELSTHEVQKLVQTSPAMNEFLDSPENQHSQCTLNIVVRTRKLLDQNGRREMLSLTSDAHGVTVLRPARKFALENVYGSEITQRQVFENGLLKRQLLDSVVRRSDMVVLVCGQSGSGKSYTTSGELSCDSPDGGIMPRFLHSIFHEPFYPSDPLTLQQFRRPCDELLLQLSVACVSGSDYCDLLDPKRTKYRAGENAAISRISIDSSEQAVMLCKRALAHQRANQKSIVWTVWSWPKKDGSQWNYVRLVDFVSDAARQKKAEDPRSNLIPSSLCTATCVLQMLLMAQGAEEVVPQISDWSEAALPASAVWKSLIQTSATNKTELLLIFAISPASNDTEETMNILRFAQQLDLASKNLHNKKSSEGWSRATLLRIIREYMRLQT